MDNDVFFQERVFNLSGCYEGSLSSMKRCSAWTPLVLCDKLFMLLNSTACFFFFFLLLYFPLQEQIIGLLLMIYLSVKGLHCSWSLFYSSVFLLKNKFRRHLDRKIPSKCFILLRSRESETKGFTVGQTVLFFKLSNSLLQLQLHIK